MCHLCVLYIEKIFTDELMSVFILEGYVTVSIEGCPFTAICCVLTQCQKQEGGCSSEGGQDEEFCMN